MSSDRDAPPNPLGPCKLLYPLGSGGAGTVYLARLIEDRPYASAGTQVAVKILDPEFLESATVLRRFLREAELGRQVRHPSVVRTFDIGATDADGTRFHYLVLEYVEGRTLRELMRELGTFPEPLLVDLAQQIASGLEAIHEAGAAHRDLKPGNILITPDYQVKLMDLGVAFLIENSTRLTREGYFVGTVLYAAPEQVRGEEVGPPADLYSLGILLYEAATAVQPFEGATAQETIQRQLGHTPPKAGDLNPQLTSWMEEVIACLMAKEPPDRFATAGELLAALEQGEASAWWARRQRELDGQRPSQQLSNDHVSHESPFIGRYHELQTLRTLFRDAQEGSGRAVLIEGEAGVGKTRLLDELARRLFDAHEPVQLLYGSNAPGQVGDASGALSRAVLDHFGSTDLERRLGRYLTATPRLVPGFTALLTGRPLPTGAMPLSTDAVQAVFCYLASVLAVDQPLLWVVEDLHFATAETLGLFTTLARQAPEMAILLVGTLQPGRESQELEPLLRLDHVHRLTLRRLSQRQVQEMLRGLLDSDAAMETFGRRLAARSDGNPLFVVELVRELRQRSGEPEITDEQGTESREVAVPSSVRELLLSRLAEAVDQDRELLEAGAVQGFSFDPDLCARVLGMTRLEALTRIAGLESRLGVVRTAGNGFAFDHHHLQEVLYQGIAEERRESLHRDLAGAFEEREELADKDPGAMDGRDAVFLSRHYLWGGDRRGLRTVLRAIDYLGYRYQNNTLLSLADRALEVLGADQVDLRCDLRLRQARCLEMRGRRDLQRAAAEDAVAAARSLGDSARLGWAELTLARYATAVEDFPSARQLLDRAYRRAEEEGPPQLVAEILAALGSVQIDSGFLDAALSLEERQLQLARSLGNPAIEGRGRYSGGRARLGLGLYDQAREVLEAAVAAFQRAEDRHGETLACTSLGRALHSLGRLREANQQLEHAVTLARNIGFSRGALKALCELAALHLDEGRLDLAEKLLEGCLRSCRGRGMRQLEALALLRLGDLYRLQRDQGRAEMTYEEALAQQQSLGANRTAAQTCFALGRLLYEEGDEERARTMLEEAARLTEDFRLDRPGPLPKLYLALLSREPPARIAIPERCPVMLQAEGYYLLHRIHAPGDPLGRALELLEAVGENLETETRELFWRFSPVARSVRRATRGRREGTSSTGS